MVAETRTIYAGEATGYPDNGDEVLPPVGSYATDMFSDGLDSTYVECRFRQHEFHGDISYYHGLWATAGLDIPNPYTGDIDPASVHIETFIRAKQLSGGALDIRLGMGPTLDDGDTFVQRYLDGFTGLTGTPAALGPGVPDFIEAIDYTRVMEAMSADTAGYVVSPTPVGGVLPLLAEGIAVVYEMRCELSWDYSGARRRDEPVIHTPAPPARLSGRGDGVFDGRLGGPRRMDTEPTSQRSDIGVHPGPPGSYY